MFGLLLALVGAAILYIHFNGWTWARGPLARLIGARLGRPVTIAGDLDVRLGWHPSLTAERVEIGNPGGATPPLFSAGRVALRLRLAPLLAGRWRFESLELDYASLDWAQQGHRAASPRTTGAEDAAAPSAPHRRSSFSLPRDIRIAHSVVRYRDPTTGRGLEFAFDRLAARGAEDADYQVRARGRYNGQPMAVSGVLGPWEVFWRNEPYPLRLEAVAGDTRARLQGRMAAPRQLDGVSAALELSGRSLDELWALFALPLAETPAYHVRGRFTRDGRRFGLHAFDGEIGRSDLRGWLTVDLRGAARPLLRADLRSRRMEVADFKGFWGARPASAPAAKSGPVFPDRPFSFAKLRAMDADVDFRAASVRGARLLDDARLSLELDAGRLRLRPLDIGYAGGRLRSRATLDARTRIATVTADVALESIDLARFTAGLPVDPKTAGTFGGRAHFTTRGNSLRRMASELDGELGFMLEGGRIGETVLELVAIDLSEALVAHLYGNQPAPIHCLVGTFEVADGRATARSLLLDTDDVRVTGQGTIDLAKEKLDLRLHQHPKDFSIGTLRSPIDIEGGFRTRRAHVRRSGLLRRGGAAVALGTLVHPLAALLPLVELGRGEKPGACAAAIADLRSIAPEPPAPPGRRVRGRRS